MFRQFIQTPLYPLVLGLLCGVLGFRVGWRLPGRLALPAVQGLMGFAAFALSWRWGAGVGGAWTPAVAGALAVGAWAFGGTLIALPTFIREPTRIDARVLRARKYREEMLDWLRSGTGPESRPVATARQHLYELTAYLVAALVSANLLAITMGAVLLNYMNAYVAHLLGMSRRAWTVRLLAWNSWSVVRVAAYVMLGSACAAPLARRVGYPADIGELRALWIAGGVGVVLDLVLKLLLSRPCGRILAAALPPEA